MLKLHPGPGEKIYSVAKIATVVNSLEAEGVLPAAALKGLDLSADDLRSPETRVSLNQVIECYRNASRLSPDPYFGYHTGLRFHVSTYGMYGFAILSSTSFRKAAWFAEQYHQLETPVAKFTFSEDGDRALWKISPASLPNLDPALGRSIVEVQLGTAVSLHRDVMGFSFAPSQMRFTYGALHDRQADESAFGCPVLFDQSDNAMIFDRRWMDGSPELGNELTYLEAARLCDELLKRMQLKIGPVGEVREAVLHNLGRPVTVAAVSKRLGVPVRTLKRRLQQQGTSYREIVDEVRTEVAIKYLRETDLSIEDIAYSLGFSEVANFRRAFRRWTKETPNQFKTAARGR